MKATIKRGTTPVLDIELPGVMIQDCTVYIVLDQDDRQIVKSNYNNNSAMTLEPIMDGDIQTGTKVKVQFSQRDTLALRSGKALVEARWIDEEGVADKSGIGSVMIPRTLFEKVIVYGG